MVHHHHGEKFHPEAAGCRVTKDDISILIGSITCCLAYCIYGASYTSLSAAVPQLAKSLDADSSSFGIAYTARGLGFLTGTLIVSYLFSTTWFKLPKTFCVCCTLILSGLMLLLVAFSHDFSSVVGLFFVQGVSFGGVVMMANCAIPEFWGKHAQPWMQALQLSYSAGAVSAPLLVGSIPYRFAFYIIAACSMAPIGTLFLGYVSDAKEAHAKRKLNTSFQNTQREAQATVNYSTVDILPTICEEGRSTISSEFVSPTQSTKTDAALSPQQQADSPQTIENEVSTDNLLSEKPQDGVNEIIIFDAETHAIRPRADSGLSLNFSPHGLAMIPSFHESLKQFTDDSQKKTVVQSSKLSTKMSFNHSFNLAFSALLDNNKNTNSAQQDSNKSQSQRNIVDRGSQRDVNTSTRGTTRSVRSTSRALKMNNVVIPIPFTIKCLAGLFFFLYMGIASAFPSWITIYALNVGVTDSDASAAYLISVYMGSVALGRILTIFTAIHVSTTKILRIQLISCVVATVILVCISEISYAALAIAVALMGFSVSGVFGLAMTVLTDYGFTMNPFTTTLFMVGTNVGDSTLPLGIGYLMQGAGDESFVYITLCVAVALAAVYAAIHIVSTTGDFGDLSAGEDDEDDQSSVDNEKAQQTALDANQIELTESWKHCLNVEVSERSERSEIDEEAEGGGDIV